MVVVNSGGWLPGIALRATHPQTVKGGSTLRVLVDAKPTSPIPNQYGMATAKIELDIFGTTVSKTVNLTASGATVELDAKAPASGGSYTGTVKAYWFYQDKWVLAGSVNIKVNVEPSKQIIVECGNYIWRIFTLPVGKWLNMCNGNYCVSLLYEGIKSRRFCKDLDFINGKPKCKDFIILPVPVFYIQTKNWNVEFSIGAFTTAFQRPALFDPALKAATAPVFSDILLAAYHDHAVVKVKLCDKAKAWISSSPAAGKSTPSPKPQPKPSPKPQPGPVPRVVPGGQPSVKKGGKGWLLLLGVGAALALLSRRR